MDINEDKIIEWAMYYASYDELKSTAKNIYRIFAEQREQYYPDEKISAKDVKTAIHYAKKKKQNENKNGVTTTYTTPKRKNKRKKFVKQWVV
jgi:hypothetical protein